MHRSVETRTDSFPSRYVYKDSTPIGYSGSLFQIDYYAPTGIVWSGMLANTGLLGAPMFFVALPWRRLVGAVRKRQGLCPNCKYNLLCNHEAGCPECGWNIPAQKPAQENTTGHQPVVQV